MLAKDGKIIADDDFKVSFESDRVTIVDMTGKPVADVTRYTYQRCRYALCRVIERETTILQAILTERAPLFKRIIARLIGFDGAYHRFTGAVTIEKFEGGDARGAFGRSRYLGTDAFVKARSRPAGGRGAARRNCAYL